MFFVEKFKSEGLLTDNETQLETRLNKRASSGWQLKNITYVELNNRMMWAIIIWEKS